MSALDDAFHKLKRAKEHLENFARNVNEAFNEKGLVYNFESYPYPKPAGTIDTRQWSLVTVFIQSAPAIKIEDAILMGEAIQNFRSALDYFAWAWYLRSGSVLTESQERQIYFPMIRDSKSFNSLLNQRLPNSPDKAFIERYQPYQSTDAGLAMYYLRTLSDTDKHRIIVPTMMLPAGGDISLIFPKGCEIITVIERIQLGQDMREGTKMMSVIIAGSPPSERFKPSVNARATLVPVFPIGLVRPRPPEEIVAVDSALNCIGKICSEILTAAAKYF